MTMRTVFTFTALTALALGASAGAQQQPVFPPAAILAQVPKIGPIPAYQPPRSYRDQLPNGLRIVVVEDHRFPLVTLRLSVRAGSAHVPVAEAGLADAEAELLSAGTPARTARQIAEEAAANGGEISADADRDFITVETGGLSSHARAVMALLADVVLHPTFPEAEVQLRKANMLQELQLNRSDPEYLGSVQFSKLLYGANPYATIAPSEESIATLTRQRLLDYHRALFLPNNDAVLVIAGDITAPRAHMLAEAFFADWTIGNPGAPAPVPPPARHGREVAIVARPGSAQSSILIGNLGVTRQSPEYFPLLVANEVLGGSFNSRLVTDIREKRGYTYGIYSYNDPMLNYATWQISSQVRTPITGTALAAILADVQGYLATAPSGAEIEQAQHYLEGRFIRHLATQEGVSDEFLMVARFHLPQDYLATYMENIEAITPGAALAAARQAIHPERALVVVVGDPKTIRPELARFTSQPIAEYNEKGERMSPPQATAK